MGMEGTCYQGKRVRLWKILWKKAAFISAQWFSDFANFRRDGYDFDALYDDGLANYRDKELYELLERESPILSGELKRKGNYRRLPVYFKEQRELPQKNTSSKFRLLLTGQLVKSKNTRGIQDEC